MISRGTRPLRVKFILPALTEATSPYWRPIKYSLFPPLGLATLAAYLRSDDEAVIVDEHVDPLRIDDQPDLVLIQVDITRRPTRSKFGPTAQLSSRFADLSPYRLAQTQLYFLWEVHQIRIPVQGHGELGLLHQNRALSARLQV
jgi:hypothetical protein